MSDDMMNDALEISGQALDKYNLEKDMAAYIKREFDKRFGPTWHCIVGKNFGSYVTHETKVHIIRIYKYSSHWIIAFHLFLLGKHGHPVVQEWIRLSIKFLVQKTCLSQLKLQDFEHHLDLYSYGGVSHALFDK